MKESQTNRPDKRQTAALFRQQWGAGRQLAAMMTEHWSGVARGETFTLIIDSGYPERPKVEVQMQRHPTSGFSMSRDPRFQWHANSGSDEKQYAILSAQSSHGHEMRKYLARIDESEKKSQPTPAECAAAVYAKGREEEEAERHGDVKIEKSFVLAAAKQHESEHAVYVARMAELRAEQERTEQVRIAREAATMKDAAASIAAAPPLSEDNNQTAWRRYSGSKLEPMLTEIKQLGDSPVALIDARFIIELARRGGRFRRRQDLPREAFLSLKTLRKLSSGGINSDCLRIIAVSHPWQQPDHPDPKGINIQPLARVLKAFIAKSGGTYGVFLECAAGTRTVARSFELYDRWSAPCATVS